MLISFAYTATRFALVRVIGPAIHPKKSEKKWKKDAKKFDKLYFECILLINAGFDIGRRGSIFGLMGISRFGNF